MQFQQNLPSYLDYYVPHSAIILGTLFHWSSIIPCVDIVIIPIVQMRKLRLNSHSCNVVKLLLNQILSDSKRHSLVHTLHYCTQRNNSRFWKRRYPKNTFLSNNVQNNTGSESSGCPKSAGSMPALRGMQVANLWAHRSELFTKHTEQWLICGRHSTQCSSGHTGYSQSPLK